MRLSSVYLVATLTAGLAMSADRPVFSGTWMLDTQQSAGNAPAWASMTVAQKGPWFSMAQSDKNGRVIRTIEGECRTDRRFHPVVGGNGGSISCKWDGSTLVTN